MEGERVSGVNGGLGPGPGEGVPTGLTQDAHVVFALPLVRSDEVVKGVGEVLEECVLFVHLQPQDAVQELADGAVCGRQGASSCVQAASPSSPSPLISAPLPILEVPAIEGLTLLHVQAAGPGLTPANAH